MTSRRLDDGGGVVIGFPEKKKERQRDQEEKEKKNAERGEGPSLEKKRFFIYIFLYKNIIPKIHNHTNNLYTFNLNIHHINYSQNISLN